ncbi:MAG: hypothetical protein HOW97_38325, partial [Catenulispora sp.]|nr:hypothetical protein [Catenulispora sp.]
TLRAVGGAAAVATVAVGSVTLSGVFGSDTGAMAPGSAALGTAVTAPPSSAPGHGPAPSTSGVVAPPPSTAQSAPTAPAFHLPPTWVLPPAATVTDPEWVTPRAIVAELAKILPQGTQTSDYSGSYAYGANSDPRDTWAFTGALAASIGKKPVRLQVTLHKFDTIPTDTSHCSPPSCTAALLPGGGIVRLGYIGGDEAKTRYVWVFRPDGMSVQINVSDSSKVSDDELFALAANADWGSLKMEKAFVQNAETTIKGDFGNPPSQ